MATRHPDGCSTVTLETKPWSNWFESLLGLFWVFRFIFWFCFEFLWVFPSTVWFSRTGEEGVGFALPPESNRLEGFRRSHWNIMSCIGSFIKIARSWLRMVTKSLLLWVMDCKRSCIFRSDMYSKMRWFPALLGTFRTVQCTHRPFFFKSINLNFAPAFIVLFWLFSSSTSSSSISSTCFGTNIPLR